MEGFKQALQEYEYKMTHPYDIEDEDIEEDESYWRNVDSQMEELKFEEAEND